jgi:putative DNA primase/helicase
VGNSPIQASEPACGASSVPTVRPPRSAAGNSYQPLDVVQFANVPKELQDGKRFVCWREETRNGKPTKVPVNPHTGNEAESDNPVTWCTLAEAVAFHQTHRKNLQGLGRMFDPADGIIGVDFDDCLDDHGNIIPGHVAAEWLPRLNSYSEISPSGRGVKVWLKARLDLDGKTGRRDTKQGVEIYREHRYFTPTGRRLLQFSANVEERQSVIAAFYRAIFSAKKSAAVIPTPHAPPVLTDAEIIRRASEAHNGAKFRALWAGDFNGCGSQSEADAKLCSMLWFWTGNRETVRRLFSHSPLGQREKWTARPDYQQSTLDLACRGEVYSPERRNKTAPTRDELQAAFDDPRPKVRLPGDNWLLSETAATLGQHLGDRSLFVRNGEIVLLEASELRSVSPQTFRTLVEQYVVCYRQRTFKDASYEVNVTMRDDEARGIMASPQFTERLRRLRRLNLCRLPVFRDDGKLELPPDGYDLASKTLTVSSVAYAEDMSLAVAIETLNDLLSEFCFADGERSKAVAVAALIGLYAAQLLPEGALRPCFIVTKNAEGAGASTLVSCAVVPVIGRLPTGVKSDDDDETRKALTAAVREARLVMLFDNQKSRLSSAALEAFVSSPTWSDRLLGVNQTFTGQNIATVFITANGCTVSPDMRRRSLVIELHLEAEHAEDRQFGRPLDLPTLLALRPKILAACWSLVRHWHTQGQPLPSRSHSAFPTWAKVIGGIVQAAGFACPLNTANVAVAADEDGEAMRRLVDVMQPGAPYMFAEIVELCQFNGCFDGLVGDIGAELKNATRVTLARLLGRYDHRLVGNCRFVIDGKGHKRRYHIDVVESDTRSHAPHAVSIQSGRSPHARADQQERAERVERASRPTEPATTELEIATS